MIICVGETLEERDAGTAEAVVSRQIEGSVPAGESAAVAASRLAVAYEPVWAIGTGRVAAVEDVIAMHVAVRVRLAAIFGEEAEKIRILYGGSVNGENAASLGLDGTETFDFAGLKRGATELEVTATKADGTKKTFKAKVRINTPKEWDYYAHGGVLQYMLRQMAS